MLPVIVSPNAILYFSAITWNFIYSIASRSFYILFQQFLCCISPFFLCKQRKHYWRRVFFLIEVHEPLTLSDLNVNIFFYVFQTSNFCNFFKENLNFIILCGFAIFCETWSSVNLLTCLTMFLKFPGTITSFTSPTLLTQSNLQKHHLLKHFWLPQWASHYALRHTKCHCIWPFIFSASQCLTLDQH